MKNKFEWTYHGIVFDSSSRFEWMYSHVGNSTSFCIEDGKCKVFFATRDKNNDVRVASIILSIINNNCEYIEDSVSRVPVLDISQAGYFDDNAIFPSCIVRNGASLLLFYAGRSRAAGKIYNVAIGVAESVDGGRTFCKKFKSPIVSRSEFDPWMVGPCAIICEDQIWKMWYTSGIGWTKDLQNSIYNIKYAISRDGLNWERSGITAIDHESGETNIAVPTVVRGKHKYHMWYCNFIGGTYGIGYANSLDGIRWERYDQTAEVLNNKANDSLAYPHVFQQNDKLYMLCSVGNYGSKGLGVFSCEINSDEL